MAKAQTPRVKPSKAKDSHSSSAIAPLLGVGLDPVSFRLKLLHYLFVIVTVLICAVVMFATECHESYLVGPGGAWNGTCYPRQVKAKFSNVRLCIRQNVSVGNPSPNEEFPIDYGSMRVVPAKIISEISPEHFNVLRVERAKALEGLRADSVLHCYMMVSLRPYKLLFGGTARQCFCCQYHFSRSFTTEEVTERSGKLS